MLNKAIRPYEMSVWTLRDTYIATLRATDIENKGQVEEPEMTLNTDGTQELTFKIPMYIQVWDETNKRSQLKENPRWYDLKHGLLMVGLRKIKVIFHKGTKDVKIYEFLVTEVKEEHSNDGSLFCSVTCSGLAFQELGKKGYKISLSSDLFLLENNEYLDEIAEQNEKEEWTAEQYQEALNKAPIQNINYWCDKVFDHSDWKYSIQMDWATYDGYVYRRIEVIDEEKGSKIPYVEIGKTDSAELGTKPKFLSAVGRARVNSSETAGDADENAIPVIERIVSYENLTDSEKASVNRLRDQLHLRRNDKIYEDEYVTSWEAKEIINEETNEKTEVLSPISYEKFHEKERPVDSENSNIYNATQAIAEAFGVYCKYKYYYDDNYHIIDKEVIFYNDFMDELNGVIDLTYKYDVSSVTRNMDSNDICTKLIVSSVDDDSSASGKLSIMNTSANKSGEDFILNFDYLYQTGGIEKDQYEAIDEFEYQMHVCNEEITELSEKINILQKEINELEAKIAVNKNIVMECTDLYGQADSQLRALTNNESGTIKYGPRETRLISDIDNETTYGLELTEKGIQEDTIHLYRKYNVSTGETSGSEITLNTEKNIKHDESGNIIGITGITINDGNMTVYIEYNYIPEEYYKNLLNFHSKNLFKAQTALDNDEETLKKKQTDYDDDLDSYNSKIKEKEEILADFEKMMGPALREGTWQPETYNNYGTKKTQEFKFNKDIPEKLDDEIFLLWDEEPFDGEQKGYYELGIDLEKHYYPYIELTDILSKISDILAEQDSDNPDFLRFKYVYTLESTLIQHIGNEYSITLLDGITKTGATKEQLEENVIKYGLRQMFNIDSKIPDEKIDINSYSDDVILNIRNRYGLSISTNHYFTLGSTMFISFIKVDEEIKPVLLLTGAEDLEDVSIITNGAELCTMSIDVKVPKENRTITQDETEITIDIPDYNNISTKEVVNTLHSLTSESIKINETPKYVYPRICIKNFLLKTENDELTLNMSYEVSENETKTIKLNNYSDYSILSRDDGYYITIDGQSLVGYANFDKTIQMDYVISNAELNIYLDALEVSKTNAFPQVSYEVDVSYLNEEFMYDAYNQLNRIVHINDFELKFENVLGYISELNLKLDKPWEDSIEVKNYKTKFEDLFTKIVASTEQMKANANIYDKAAMAFNSDGLLKSSLLQESLDSTNVSLELARGRLTIDKFEGIRAENGNGAVSFTGAGIYCADSKNENGEWSWNSGITPKGINANLLTAGQIDTNLVRIYSGENLAFQMNSQGLYAYKTNGVNSSKQLEYVVHNSEGLFLTQKEGTEVQLDNGELITMNKTVDRVEISWNGIIIRDIDDNQVFYADDYGNLTLDGTIKARSGEIGGWQISKNALLSIPGSNINNIAGMASGMMTNGYNSDGGSSEIYKVFWAGADVYGNSKFYVNSNGNVFADSLTVNNSLVAEHITLNGIALEEALPEVREAPDGIHVTPLDGNIFRVLSDGELEEQSLQFAITGHNVKFVDNEGASDAVENIKFYIGSFNNENEDTITDEDVDEDGEPIIDDDEEEEGEEITYSEIAELLSWTEINSINLLTSGRTYLTFELNYDIISQIEDSPIYFKVEYKNYSDVFYVQVLKMSADILSVQIFSDKGFTFRNRKIEGITVDNEEITLTARLWKNGVEVTGEDLNNYNFQWYKKIIVSNIAGEEYETQLIENAVSNTYVVTPEQLINSKTGIYTCEVEEKGSE